MTRWRNLSRREHEEPHVITEHEDGTVTVAPSILINNSRHNGEWHGYLERGVWRKV